MRRHGRGLEHRAEGFKVRHRGELREKKRTHGAKLDRTRRPGTLAGRARAEATSVCAMAGRTELKHRDKQRPNSARLG